MRILPESALCFDDVLIVPQYSDIASRTTIDISTQIAGILMKVPIISANMDSVTEATMATAMHLAGGLGILHRYMTQERMIEQIRTMSSPCIPSIGVQEEDKKKVKAYLDNGIFAICIDVAHGDSKRSLKMVEWCKGQKLKVIAGNVCTSGACRRMLASGADIIKVGIGPGSLCTTRLVTGHGYPQFSAIMECVQVVKGNARIIADGGIRNSGDIVKALAAGADAVMIGNLFAGCLETPGTIKNGQKIYRGMASVSAQMNRDGRVHNFCPEGESMEVPVKGNVAEIMEELAGGIRSGLSYSGALSLTELHEGAVIVRVSSNCTRENGPHGKNS